MSNVKQREGTKTIELSSFGGKTDLEYKIIGGGGQTHICDWHIHKTKQTTKYQLNIKKRENHIWNDDSHLI